MSAGSLGKRWPGAIQDDEHVQAVLRTLAQFVERDTVYYKHEEAMLRQLRNAHRLRGKYTDETKQQLHATLMKVGERTIQEQIGVERKTHGRKTPGSTQRVYWGALSSGPLPNHGRNSQSLHRLLDPSWTQRGKALLGTKHPLVFAEINERASGRKLLADALGFARFVLHERSHRVPRSSNLLQATNST
jgi:hypothetical protein